MGKISNWFVAVNSEKPPISREEIAKFLALPPADQLDRWSAEVRAAEIRRGTPGFIAAMFAILALLGVIVGRTRGLSEVTTADLLGVVGILLFFIMTSYMALLRGSYRESRARVYQHLMTSSPDVKVYLTATYKGRWSRKPSSIALDTP